MAQFIYWEWFVNYRFPGHKNVKMVDSELGQIPDVKPSSKSTHTAWPVVTLESLCELSRPITYGVVKPGPVDDEQGI